MARRPDQGAPCDRPPLRQDDLVLRDLGYLRLESLRQIEAQDAWYLSRLKQRGGCLSRGRCASARLGVGGALPAYYPDESVIDLSVFIGHERVPCRLLAYRLPDHVVQERRRKALEEARKKRPQAEQEYLDWLSFACISRCHQQVWPPKVVGTVYRFALASGIDV